MNTFDSLKVSFANPPCNLSTTDCALRDDGNGQYHAIEMLDPDIPQMITPKELSSPWVNSFSYPPSQTDWQIVRATITKLYKREGKPLNEVMKRMQQDYGFRATKKMYKTRISRWKIQRKFSLNDVQTILWMQAHSRLDAIFMLRGKIVDMKDVAQYQRRKRLSTSEAISRIDTGKAPISPDVRLIAPTEIQKHCAISQETDCVEAFLFETQTFMDRALSSKLCTIGVDGYSFRALEKACNVYNHKAQKLRDRFLSIFRIGAIYASRGRLKAAFASYRQAFYDIERLIRLGDPLIWRDLLELSSSNWNFGQSNELQMLLNHARDMSSCLVRADQPHFAILHALSNLTVENLNHAYERTLELFVAKASSFRRGDARFTWYYRAEIAAEKCSHGAEPCIAGFPSITETTETFGDLSLHSWALTKYLQEVPMSSYNDGCVECRSFYQWSSHTAQRVMQSIHPRISGLADHNYIWTNTSTFSRNIVHETERRPGSRLWMLSSILRIAIDYRFLEANKMESHGNSSSTARPVKHNIHLDSSIGEEDVGLSPIFVNDAQLASRHRYGWGLINDTSDVLEANFQSSVNNEENSKNPCDSRRTLREPDLNISQIIADWADRTTSNTSDLSNTGGQTSFSPLPEFRRLRTRFLERYRPQHFAQIQT